MANLIKEFNKKYYSTVLTAFRAVKTSGLIGSVVTADIEEKIKLKTRGETPLEKFKIKNNLTFKGSSFPLMQFEEEVKSEQIALRLILWETSRYGKVLTTPTDKEEILKLEIGRILGGFLEEYAVDRDFNQTRIFETIFKEMMSWVKASEYNDVPVSVCPIFEYIDREGDSHSIYLNGSYIINDIQEEETLSDEQIARHLLGEIRREYFRRAKK